VIITAIHLANLVLINNVNAQVEPNIMKTQKNVTINAILHVKNAIMEYVIVSMDKTIIL